MKRKNNILCCLISLGLLSACGHSYGPATQQDGFGYSDRKLEADHYAIQVKGDIFSDQPTAKAHFYQRAKELCGGGNYEVIRLNEEKLNVSSRGMLGEKGTQYPFVDGEIRCLK